MNTRKHVILSLVFAMSWSGYVSSAEGPAKALITVEKLHCKGCARKIASQLYTVAGVKEVVVNMQQKLFLITPQAKILPSPRAMWERRGEGGGPSPTFGCAQRDVHEEA